MARSILLLTIFQLSLAVDRSQAAFQLTSTMYAYAVFEITWFALALFVVHGIRPPGSGGFRLAPPGRKQCAIRCGRVPSAGFRRVPRGRGNL
eukprot:6928459-Alexandrium_andersonii.AAC.1